jgi:hypothetical protein
VNEYATALLLILLYAVSFLIPLDSYKQHCAMVDTAHKPVAL